MKDKTGRLVEAGDIMAEEKGMGYILGEKTIFFRLWEVPVGANGNGISYSHDGTKHESWWFHTNASYKIDLDNMPDGFLFAFKHGLDSLTIKEKYVKSDVIEIINNSDWKKNALTPDMVDDIAGLQKVIIVSFEDLAEKWDSIFTHARIPNEIIEQIMKLTKYKNAPIHNGEIGIAAMQDAEAFYAVYANMKKWKEAGILLEKCKELDLMSQKQ